MKKRIENKTRRRWAELDKSGLWFCGTDGSDMVGTTRHRTRARLYVAGRIDLANLQR